MTRTLLLLLPLAACAEADLATEQGRDGPESSPDGAVADDDDFFRLDVFPSAPQADAEGVPTTLLPHTFEVTLEGGPVSLDLRDPAIVEGRITGYRVAPTWRGSLPGREELVDALVTFERDDSAQSRALASGEDGAYAVRIVPDGPYRLSVVPSSPDLPLYTESIEVTGDAIVDVDLGVGVPLWGFVTDGAGNPIPDARVHVESVHGPHSTTVLTDDEGFYLLRVTPGSYTVVSAGRDNGRDPTVRSDLLYVEEAGREVTITYPSLAFHSVGGRILPADDLLLRDGAARFTAVALDGYPEGTELVVETPADDHGNFDTRLIAGTWRIELFPRDHQDLTPVSLGPVTITGTTDLGATSLEPMAQVFGSVTDAEGAAVGGTLVECTEIGFGARVFSAWADESGEFDLRAPRVPVSCTLTPPPDRSDLALTRVELDSAQETTPHFVLASGQLLEGQVTWEGVPLALALVEVRDAKGQLLGTTLSSEQDGTFAVRVNRY